jgi:hypothetical protein
MLTVFGSQVVGSPQSHFSPGAQTQLVTAQSSVHAWQTMSLAQSASA